MKIDRLIEKTTEKDEAKKWKVVVGIVVGLVLAGGLFAFGLMVIFTLAILLIFKLKKWL